MSAKSKATKEPKAIGVAEYVLIAPAVTVAKHIYDAVKEGRPAISPAAPLTFAIVDAGGDSTKHFVTVVCSNLGAHGVYVEDVFVTKPDGISGNVTVMNAAPMGMGTPVDPKRQSLPVLVSSGGQVTLRLTMDRFDPKRLKEEPSGTMKVRFTVLGVAKSDLHKEVDFCVRQCAKQATVM